MKLSTRIFSITCMLATTPIMTWACSPVQGAKPLNADQLLAKAPFAFIVTAQEASAQQSKTAIRMKVECVVKTTKPADAQKILNATYVMVGPFQGTSLCGVDAKQSERMMIFVDKVTEKNGICHFELRGDSSFPHSQKRPIPQQVEGKGLALIGTRCPAAKCKASTKVVTQTKIRTVYQSAATSCPAVTKTSTKIVEVTMQRPI